MSVLIWIANLLRVLVLGAAAGGGFPQWNSNSDACNRARKGDVASQTQSSIAVTANGRNWYLCNASPDIRQQLNNNPALYPREGMRHSPVSGVVLTNADVDHIAGLLTLRESQPLNIFATKRVLTTLKKNSIFDVLNPDFVSRNEIFLGHPFVPKTPEGISLDLEFEAFSVPGKIALYLEDESADSNFGTVEGDTVGLRIANQLTGQYFFYIPGCASMPKQLAKRISGAPLVFFDGTLYEDAEMITRKEGHKTGNRMGHMSMSGPDGVIVALKELNITRKIFIHINNTNPVLLEDSRERKIVERADWEIAYDGMEISIEKPPE
ncbi:MAG: Coenzyme PQQ synthesis protein B [Alphaproteobacteria bacterium MarineAlpha3_Bin5]|nr:MAG: Coenzyme PQQ synthesis protein B [Alphaproteobacteria bacterium MarineAlpha3_Bin5]